MNRDTIGHGWLDIKCPELISKDMADLMVKECELGLKAKIDSLESIKNRADKLLAIYMPICTALSIYTFHNFKDIFTNYLPTTSLLCLITSLIGIYFCWENIKEYEVGDLGEHPNKILRSEYVDNNLDTDLKYVAICIAICRNIQERMNFNEITLRARSSNNQWSLKMFFVLTICPFIYPLFLLLSFLACH